MILLTLDRIHPSSNSKSFSFLWNLFTKMRLFSQSWSAEGITISSIFKCLLSAEDSNFVKLRFPLDRRLRYFLPQSIFSTALREKGNAVNEKSILYKVMNWTKFMSLQPIINRFSSLIELIINFFSVSESQKTIYYYFTTEKGSSLLANFLFVVLPFLQCVYSNISYKTSTQVQKPSMTISTYWNVSS